MAKKEFFCYGCQKHKPIELKHSNQGRGRCTSCALPQDVKRKLGIPRGVYAGLSDDENKYHGVK